MYIAPAQNYKMKVNYIAELNLPSKSAYSIHVMKICEAFSLKNTNLNLFVFNRNKNLNVFKKYNCSRKFKIKDFNLNNINFLTRVIFSFRIVKFVKKQDIIISRSIVAALILSFLGFKVILELHHELHGFTKYLFIFSKSFTFFKKIKFIFISKYLLKKFNLKNDTIILDDAVCLKDFYIKRNFKKKKNTCAYTGSLAKGKGLENIFKISTYNKNISFDIYGDFSNSKYDQTSFKKFRNVKYCGHVDYNKIPLVLSKYKVALMPYSKKVYVRSKNLETSKYMSPLKLFDYMASKNIIIASKMQAYSHILNNQNSVILENSSAKLWSKKINYVLKNYSKLSYLKNNAFKKVKKFTWEKRAELIIDFANERLIGNR